MSPRKMRLSSQQMRPALLAHRRHGLLLIRQLMMRVRGSVVIHPRRYQTVSVLALALIVPSDPRINMGSSTTTSDLSTSTSASNSTFTSRSQDPAVTGIGNGTDEGSLAEEDSSNGPLIGGIAAAVIIILLLLVGGFLLYRRRAQDKRRQSMAAQRAAPYAEKSSDTSSDKSESFVSPERRDSDRSVLLYNPPAASGTGVSRNTVGTVSSRRTHTTITENDEEELDGASYHDAALAAAPVPPYSLGVPTNQSQSSESVMRGMVPLKTRPAPNQAQDDSVRLVNRNTGGWFDGKRASQHTGQLHCVVRLIHKLRLRRRPTISAGPQFFIR